MRGAQEGNNIPPGQLGLHPLKKYFIAMINYGVMAAWKPDAGTP